MTTRRRRQAPERHLPRADRHCRGGCGERTDRLGADRQAARQDIFADLAIDESRRQIAHYCGLGAA